MDQNKVDKRGIIYIVIATLGFSIIPILAQIGLATNLGASTLLFYRFFLAFVVFFLYVIIAKKKVKLEEKSDYIHVFLAGLIYSLQCIFFFSSFKYISSSLGEIIYQCYPFFVLILAYFFLNEKITKGKLIGVALSIMGTIITIYGPLGNNHIRGIIYVIITAFISSVYIIFSKQRVSNIDTTVLTMYLCLVCSIVYLLYSLVRKDFVIITDLHLVFNVTVLAICSTVIGFFAFMKAISLLSAGYVSILSLLEPIFTIVLAYLILGVALTPLQLLGTTIVLIGVYIYERGN
ncbi:MAG: DMT family transporter [Tissierellia bacterium]|nr:DMT family transporter [Tissierellia bacterium]